MSLILDALRRAERERESVRSPLLTDPVLRDSYHRRPRRWPLWIAAILVLLIGGGSIYLQRARTMPTPPPAAVAPARTPAPASRPAAPPTVQRPARPAVLPGTESLTRLEELEPDTAAESRTDTDTAAAMTPAEEDAPTDRASADGLAPQTTALPPQQPAPVVTTAPAATAESPPEIPPALLQPAKLRSLREMPPEFRADMPKLTVDVHVYEKNAARRFTLVNGKRYREGDRLAAGPALLEIVPEGLVLEYRGERFVYTLSRP